MTKQEAIEILENFKEEKTSWQYPIDVKNAIEVIISESKNPIDFNKLRDEFFAECTELRLEFENGNTYTERVISLAPHDMFEWIKNKLTTKL